jgi:hypothetical protein
MAKVYILLHTLFLFPRLSGIYLSAELTAITVTCHFTHGIEKEMDYRL